MQTSVQSLTQESSAADSIRFQPTSVAQPRLALPIQTPSRRDSLTQPLRYAASEKAESERKLSPRTDVSHRFGVRLRELRRERNLTQVCMAAEFGIDRSFISDVERGKKSLSLPMLEVIALGMKVSLSELLQNI